MSLKLGIETGSMTNHIYSSANQIEPAIGMGATILCWTDRRAATIVKVEADCIHVQEDKAKRVDKNGMSESQQWQHEPDAEAPIRVFFKTKKGWREPKNGKGLLIGKRDHYYDFSF